MYFYIKRRFKVLKSHVPSSLHFIFRNLSSPREDVTVLYKTIEPAHARLPHLQLAIMPLWPLLRMRTSRISFWMSTCRVCMYPLSRSLSCVCARIFWNIPHSPPQTRYLTSFEECNTFLLVSRQRRKLTFSWGTRRYRKLLEIDVRCATIDRSA